MADVIPLDVDGANPDEPETCLLDVHELRRELVQDRPLVLDTRLEGGWWVPPPPPRGESEAHPCAKDDDSAACDGYCIFEPNDGVRQKLCSTHLQRAENGASREWVESIVEYLKEWLVLDQQSLRMARFEGSPQKSLRFPYKTRFRNCDLRGTEFAYCDLRGVSFESGSRLRSARFANCDLSAASFNMSKPLEHIDFVRCKFTLTSIKGDSQQLLLAGGDARDLRITNAHCKQWFMRDIDFSNSDVESATLEGLRVSRGDWNNVRLRDSKVIDSVFQGTNLANVNFEDGLDFKNSLMADCVFSPQAEDYLMRLGENGLRIQNPTYEVHPLPCQDPNETILSQGPTLDELRHSLDETLSWLGDRGPMPPRVPMASSISRALVAGVSTTFLCGAILDLSNISQSWAIGAGAGVLVAGMSQLRPRIAKGKAP